MARRINPFRPGQIVAPGMFAGRYEELVALERFLDHTKSHNPHHFLILGERGIGKSSLLLYLDHVARGNLASLNDATYSFLPVTIELDRTTSFADMVKRMGREFQRVLGQHSRAKELLKNVWDFLTRFEAFGVKYDKKERPLDRDEAIDQLIAALSHVSTALAEEADGLLLLIDEADKPPADAELGIFVKLLTERLTKRGCTNVMIGLAGLPPLLTKLRKSHESSPRIFEIMTLEPLTPEERVSVVRKGLDQVADAERVTITAEAEDLISNLSEGYPHFVQQFAYSAFDADADGNIDPVDVARGAFAPNGALHQLGLKYFEQLYFDEIGSEEYRGVLRAMADDLDGWVAKNQIRDRTRLKESTLNNAITALKQRNIILPKPGKSGVYRLPTRSFAVWIRALTSTAAQAAPPST